MTRELTYAEALREALDQALTADERVLVFGEDVAAFGGVFGVTRGLQARHGEDRVFDTPLSETLIVGAAVGAALNGARPVAELQYADFVHIAMDELYNKAAKWRAMHGSDAPLPLVVRAPEGAKGGGGAEHSQSPGALFAGAGRLRVVCPATPADAKGMLTAAIRSDDPVLLLEHKALYARRGAVPPEPYATPLDGAAVVRPGTDVTVVAWASMVGRCLQAAEALTDEVDLEVIDARSIWPLDVATVVASLEHTGRLVIVHEPPRSIGPGSLLAAAVAEGAIDLLEAPIVRVTLPEVVLPQSVHLERLLVPDVPQIIAAVRRVA